MVVLLARRIGIGVKVVTTTRVAAEGTPFFDSLQKPAI